MGADAVGTRRQRAAWEALKIESARPARRWLAALYAFYQEHQRCGDLDSGLDDDRVWMACSGCGAVINRCADDD